MENTYRAKYQQLKMQYMHSVDTAFRLGYEQGLKDAQLDQMAQQQQEQDAMMQQQNAASQDPSQMGAPQDAGQPQIEEPGKPPTAPPGQQAQPMQESEHPGGTELDQHIAKLESLLGKSELSPEDLTKAVAELKSLRKAQVQAIELKKSHEAIKGIALALHKPQFKLGMQASHNMNDSAKRAVSLQHKIVEEAMNKWEEEEKKVSKGIHEIIQVEGLTTKK